MSEQQNARNLDCNQGTKFASSWPSSNKLGAATSRRLSVLLKVPVEICLLAKATIALTTLEWPLLVVYISNVPLQIGRDTEGAIAVATLVRLFASVSSQMSG